MNHDMIIFKVEEIINIHENVGKFKNTADTGRFFAKTWSGIQNSVQVKYTLLPKDQFDDCMQWLQGQIASKSRPTLARNTHLLVIKNTKDTTISPGRIYLLIENKFVPVQDGVLRLRRRGISEIVNHVWIFFSIHSQKISRIRKSE